MDDRNQHQHFIVRVGWYLPGELGKVLLEVAVGAGDDLFRCLGEAVVIFMLNVANSGFVAVQEGAEDGVASQFPIGVFGDVVLDLLIS